MAQNGQRSLVKRIPTWAISPREPFSRHDDLIPENTAPDAFDGGKFSLWRNGDYAGFNILFENLVPLIQQLNTMGFGIPNKPDELGPRLGFLKMLIEVTISLYRCSSKPKSIGGRVSTLALRPDGTYFMG
jgi:hypothetical protein